MEAALDSMPSLPTLPTTADEFGVALSMERPKAEGLGDVCRISQRCVAGSPKSASGSDTCEIRSAYMESRRWF